MSNGPRNAVGARYLLRGSDTFDQFTGPFSAWISCMPQYQTRIEARVVGAVTTVYKGWALSGTAEAADEWMIQQIVLDESTYIDVTTGIAGGLPIKDDDPFRFSWTGRAGHAYS